MIKISDAEYEVMKIIWEEKRATAMEIIKKLNSQKWNYNTVRTLIKRLQNKGAIYASKENTKTNVYIPLIEEKEYKLQISKDLIKKLYNNSIEEFVLTYFKDNSLASEELANILSQIDELEENK